MPFWHWGEAKDILDKDKSIEARETAIDANRKSPDLIPAAVMAADGYIADKKPRNATRVLKKAWSAQPHPDLAAAFARIKPDESPKDRIHRFMALTGQHKDHPETRMLEAELRIGAEDFPAARSALGDLAESDPTARSLAIMAAIERGAGSDDAVVKGWLARALTAPRGPQWVCDNCQRAHTAWDPVCDNCGAFDTFSWRTTENQATPLPGGAEMLPLIVGQIAAPVEETIDEAEEAPDEEADIVSEEIPDTEPSDEEESLGETEKLISIANADAPPADYAVIDEDEVAPLAKP